MNTIMRIQAGCILLLLSILMLPSCTADFNIGYKDGTTPLTRVLSSIKPTTVPPAGTTSSTGSTTAAAIDQTDDDNSATGFGGGDLEGLAWDGSKLILDSSGTPTNHSELNASWTPRWSALVAYWTFDTDWNDSVGANDGISQNGAALTTTTKIGSHAGSFDGVDDFSQIGTMIDLGGTDRVSESAWIFPTNTAGNQIISYFGIDGNNGVQLDWSANAGVNCWIIIGGVLFRARHSVSNFSLNEWHHIVCTYDGANIRIYVNGDLKDTVADAGNLPSGAWVGAMGNYINTPTNFGFNGFIDDVAVWKAVALSDAEVKAIYDRQSAKYSGSFTSRVLDATTTAPWTDLLWKTSLPYQKEFIAGEKTVSYSAFVNSSGSVGDSELATSAIGFWHFNETAADSLAGLKDFEDATGSGNHGDDPGAGVTYGGPGVFGRSLRTDGASGNIAFPASIEFQNRDPLSACLWVRLLAPPQNWGKLWGKWEQLHFTYNGTTTELFIGRGYPGASNASGYSVLNATPIGVFSHLCYTYDGTNEAVYKNGVLAGSGTSTFNAVANNWPMTIGKSPAGNWEYVKADIDEVGLWGRALHANEVAQLYRRGANRLKFQTRSCATNPCTVESWLGPDGTNQTYFSELHNTSIPAGGGLVLPTLPNVFFSAFSGLTVPHNRYFQYRAIFESDDPSVAVSPDLQSLRVGPTR